MSDRLGSAERPLRVAIVGSGPAGFYAADHLLRQEDVAVEVDVFDRLPTPFGLVRAGVAPDHPKIKSVIRVYEKTAARDGFRFFGNVQVGGHVSAAELADRFHAVIHAYGASTDRHLGIPGEELAGSHAATAFVAWYNAHPDFADLEFDLSCERAVVIGNGNVATDVARMLALTRPELEETDTADHAIDPLADCGVREIVILGRRGPAQAAFTNPELRELGEMQDADVQRGSRRDGAGRPEPRVSGVRRGGHHHPQERRDLHRVLPTVSPRASASESCCGSFARRSRSRVMARWSAWSSPATSSTATTPGRSGPGTREIGRRSSAGSSCDRSDTPGWAWRASRSTNAAP